MYRCWTCLPMPYLPPPAVGTRAQACRGFRRGLQRAGEGHVQLWAYGQNRCALAKAFLHWVNTRGEGHQTILLRVREQARGQRYLSGHQIHGNTWCHFSVDDEGCAGQFIAEEVGQLRVLAPKLWRSSLEISANSGGDLHIEASHRGPDNGHAEVSCLVG